MLTCSRCGVSVADSSRFCNSCGSPVSAVSGATQTVASSGSKSGIKTRVHLTTAAAGRFAPGTLLADRYRVVALLGRGGMGEVYRADDLTLGQSVALKFLPEAMANNEAALARFYNEVRIARQVSHPNVCRVYDLGESEGQPYLSMEYVDGEDLGSLLRRIGRLPADKATEIARKLCAGLAAAHDKGVLHRDLKPSNIMLDARGQVLITDFGLAGIIEQMQGAEIRNGTPAYMAPEQHAGREVTQASDIYSLGLVLYEIYTGKRAFQAESIAELVRMQAQSRPESMTTLVRDMDPAVEKAIQRCLDPDPRNRPASALAVAAALPGGDPLAMALAAGETPSPQMVAASGESTGLAPRLAIACLVAALAGMLVIAVFSGATCLVNRSGLELPPDVLRSKAAEILRQVGYTSRPADWAQGFEYAGDYVEHVRKTDKPRPNWDAVLTGRPTPLRYWYRRTQDELVARTMFFTGANVAEVTQWDPPPTRPGMIEVKLDAQGWLYSLNAVPPERESGPDKSPPFDWNVLMKAAGLDPAQLTPAAPEWTSPATTDARLAWTGTWPGPQKRPLRVEAASFRGKPVFFYTVGPWTEATPAESRPETPGQRAGNYISIGILVGVFFGGLFFAWRNYTQGRADPRGAFRLGLGMFIADLGIFIAGGHHVASFSLLLTSILALSHALFASACLAGLYIALEPMVRRRWPQSMVSWSRLLAGRLRDPLVGRDVLYGLVLASIWALVFEVRFFLILRLGGPPETTTLHYLSGVGPAFAAWLIQIPNAVQGVLLFFFLIFGLRALLRKQWLAVLAFVALFTVTRGANSDFPAVDLPVIAVVYGIAAIFLTRFGVLTFATGAFMVDVLLSAPITLDANAWYFNASLAVLLSFAALAAYAFHTSLAGRPLLKEEWFG